ncbi:MAG: nucleoside hydrolase [Erysipelotrichaceae bacterium]|nr:nucleoside hydrolase [Erysipelotrichaceae bacterium]
MDRRPVWIDTDCGVDDALALLCACALDKLEIMGMSAGVGTTTLQNTFRNTRDVLHLAKRDDIKVYPGAESSWIREYAPAPAYHGENGLGEYVLESSPAPVESKYAWDAMYEAADKYNGELSIVTIGQMTNLANTIIKYPDFKDKVKEVAIMGGAIVGGNTTAAAEANIYRDPEAAQCVFRSGMKLTLFALDVTEQVRLSVDDLKEIESFNTKVSDFIIKSTQIARNTNRINAGIEDYTLHDLCPVVYMQYPDLFNGKYGSVYAETRSTLTAGKTVSDIFTRSDYRLPENKVMIMLQADRDRTVKIIKDLFRSYE